jgi:hypothetical protein
LKSFETCYAISKREQVLAITHFPLPPKGKKQTENSRKKACVLRDSSHEVLPHIVSSISFIFFKPGFLRP